MRTIRTEKSARESPLGNTKMYFIYSLEIWYLFAFLLSCPSYKYSDQWQPFNMLNGLSFHRRLLANEQKACKTLNTQTLDPQTFRPIDHLTTYSCIFIFIYPRIQTPTFMNKQAIAAPYTKPVKRALCGWNVIFCWVGYAESVTLCYWWPKWSIYWPRTGLWGCFALFAMHSWAWIVWMKKAWLILFTHMYV